MLFFKYSFRFLLLVFTDIAGQQQYGTFKEQFAQTTVFKKGLPAIEEQRCTRLEILKSPNFSNRRRSNSIHVGMFRGRFKFD